VVLVARHKLADVLRAEGRYTESERLGHASLTGLEQKLSPGDPRVPVYSPTRHGCLPAHTGLSKRRRCAIGLSRRAKPSA
jgi:hypothetical protein